MDVSTWIPDCHSTSNKGRLSILGQVIHQSLVITNLSFRPKLYFTRASIDITFKLWYGIPEATGLAREMLFHSLTLLTVYIECYTEFRRTLTLKFFLFEPKDLALWPSINRCFEINILPVLLVGVVSVSSSSSSSSFLKRKYSYDLNKRPACKRHLINILFFF